MKQYDGIKDEELISRFKNGESEILDYLMEKYKNMVRKKARTMFLIGGENDDLIQEGMIGLFKAVRDYQPDRDAAFQTFASICVDRQIYNAIQSSNRQKHQPLNSYISLSEQDGENEEHLGDNWGENPESIIIDQENVQDLEQEKAYKVPVFTVGTYIFTSNHVVLPEGVQFCNPLYMSDLDFANWEIAK